MARDHQATGALVAMATGDLRRATGLCAASIAGFEQQGGEYGLIWVLTTFGWVRYVEGQPAEGYALMQRALEANAVVNNPTAAAAAHLGMGYGSCLADDLVRQRDHLEEALAAMRAQGSLELADWLGVAAVLAAREGRRNAALRLAGGAQAHARHTDSRLPESIRRPLHDHIVNVMAEVGPDRAAQLVEDGRQTSWDVLVTLAFEAPPERHQPATGPGGSRLGPPRTDGTDETQPTRATTGRRSRVADARHSDDRHRSVLPNPALEGNGGDPVKPGTRHTGLRRHRTPEETQDQPPRGAATIQQWLNEVSIQTVASLVAAGALALIGIMWTTMR